VVWTCEKNGRTKFELHFIDHNTEDVRRGFVVPSGYKELIMKD
jgi:hypothetical protein